MKLRGETVHAVSVGSPKGSMRFITVTGELNTDQPIELLERLLQNPYVQAFSTTNGHPELNREERPNSLNQIKSVPKRIENAERNMR